MDAEEGNGTNRIREEDGLRDLHSREGLHATEARPGTGPMVAEHREELSSIKPNFIQGRNKTKIEMILDGKWDRGSGSPLPASHLTKIKDLHGGINTQASRDAIMREPESNRMIRSQHTQMKLPPESELTVKI